MPPSTEHDFQSEQHHEIGVEIDALFTPEQTSELVNNGPTLQRLNSSEEVSRSFVTSPIEQQVSAELDPQSIRIIEQAIEQARERKLGSTFFEPRPATGPLRVFSKLLGREPMPRLQDVTPEYLIEAESNLSSNFLPKLPAGHSHKFYYTNNHDWFYARTVQTEKKGQGILAHRFIVNPDRILLVTDGVGHTVISGEELRRFGYYAHAYYNQVTTNLYFDQTIPTPPTIETDPIKDEVGYKSDHDLAA